MVYKKVLDLVSSHGGLITYRRTRWYLCGILVRTELEQIK